MAQRPLKVAKCLNTKVTVLCKCNGEQSSLAIKKSLSSNTTNTFIFADVILSN